MAIVSLERSLLCALDLYEKEFASSKTVKYFIAGLKREMVTVGDVEYPKRYVDLVHTFLVMMTKRTRSSTVEVNDEFYQVSDYEFPDHWWELANARRVYVCPNSVAVAEPYYDFQYDNSNVDILDPIEVKNFFARYNDNQPTETKINVRGPLDGYNDPVSLLDFKALCTESDCLAWFNAAGGSIDGMVSQILDVQHFAEDDNLMTFDLYEERSVSRWLMSAMNAKSRE